MNVLETAKQAEGYILDRRRYYHQHPELSGQEKNTSEQLVRDLEALGITEIHHMKNCYGLTAVIRGSKPGKLLGIRSDMDALQFVKRRACRLLLRTRVLCTPAVTIPTWRFCWVRPKYCRPTAMSSAAA